MIQKRIGLFETNSSSVHALSIPYTPDTMEEILKQLDPEVDKYLMESGLVFGKKEDETGPFIIFQFQRRINILWDYLMSIKTPAFLKRWEYLLEVLKDQPYHVDYELNPENLYLALDMRKQLIYFSGLFDDKLKLFKFIFLNESCFCAFDHLYWDENEKKEREKADLFVLSD